ncbi:MAG TPA: HesA/MoeB/ThiF family protein [Candidatus Hydrogenedentes bacterium]|nr:HesA/MoeB/ThiF family protein [Candidatus Hydrogenedentota bacterium]HOL77298.1 HesA/MoeB/ThiF family protein [Candidatus Hydrogenedentota bacterium]
MVHLTEEQRIRYARNIRIPGIGEVGQAKLRESRVAVVGLGGLGSPLCLYLAAAGIGTLGLIDADVVELSNLQRQVLHATSRIGKKKTESAAEVLQALNPEVNLVLVDRRVTAETAEGILENYDVVAEATDNFESKFLINDVCLRMKKPFATAGILGLSGQAQFVVPGKTPCLRCLFPQVPRGTPTTAELGVLGAVPGILGSLEALEIIRWVVGLWQPREDGSGRLHGVDGVSMSLRTLTVRRRPDCGCAAIR